MKSVAGVEDLTVVNTIVFNVGITNAKKQTS